LAGGGAGAGDGAWPSTWLGGIRGYLAAHFVANADKAVSLPGLVARLPVPAWVPALAGVLVVAAAIPRLIRAPIAEAAIGACLVGVAVSPHAWGYDAVMVVPALVWLLAGGGPWSTRTRVAVLVGAYALGPSWLVSRQTVVSGVAIVVLAAVASWILEPPTPAEPSR
jgi:hypothetical protein